MVSPQGFLIPSILKVSQFWAPEGCSIIPLQKPARSALHNKSPSSLGPTPTSLSSGLLMNSALAGARGHKETLIFFHNNKKEWEKNSQYTFIAVFRTLFAQNLQKLLSYTFFFFIIYIFYSYTFFKCTPLLPLNIMASFSLLLFYIIIYMPRYII